MTKSNYNSVPRGWMLEFNLFLFIISPLFYSCFVITKYNLFKNISGCSGWLLQSTQGNIMELNHLFASKNERCSFSRIGSFWVMICQFFFCPLAIVDQYESAWKAAAFLRNPICIIAVPALGEVGFYVLWLESATGMVLGYDNLWVFLKQWNAININKTKKSLEVEFYHCMK